MFRLVSFALIVSLAAFITGCSSGGRVSVTPPDDSTMLKATLEEIAAAGELGSGADNLESLLQQLKTTDTAKAEVLLADYSKLQTMNSPAAIKKQATAMLGKL